MLHYKTPRNVLKLLRSKEYGVKSNRRLDLSILRTLVTSKSAKFKKIFERHSKTMISFESQKLFFNQYKSCYSIANCNKLPRLQYNLPNLAASEKIEEILICNSSMADYNLRQNGFKNHILALTSRNTLVKYDLETGQQMERIFLAGNDIKFKHLSWESDIQTILLKSTLTKPHLSNCLLTFAILSVFPLEFIAMFELDKRIFGTDTTGASISQGILITMHQNNIVRLYSLETLFEMGMFRKPKLRDYLEDHGVVGLAGVGLPINVKLNECPQVLFEVRCGNHDLAMGGVPWHYIVRPLNSCNYFKVHSLETGLLAENGILEMERSNIEPDNAIFHPDESGRILHIGGSVVSALKLDSIDYNCYELRECFSIDETREESIPKIRVTSSGRSVRVVSFAQSIDSISEQPVQGVEFENELDVLILTLIKQCDEGIIEGHVCYHDNQTGERLVDIPLQEPWKEFSDHTIAVDLDIIVHIVKHIGRYSCYVYQLDRCLDNETDGCCETLPKLSSSAKGMLSRRATNEERTLIRNLRRSARSLRHQRR